MGRLDGKIALVTGAARGTGEQIARTFVAEGARVLLTDVLDERGEAVAKQLGASALYQHLDVRREEDWRVGMSRATGDFGGLDVLVNNAAVLIIETIENTRRDELLRLIEVNQVGPFLGIQAAIGALRARGGGSIVNVASTDGVKGMNGVTAYASTKWALRGITKSAAMELARHHIRVNSVCPDWGSHEMVESLLAPGVDPIQAVEENATRILPNPRGYQNVDRMRDVARAVLFLASDDCLTATGTDVIVDGGLTAGHIQPGIAGAD